MFPGKFLSVLPSCIKLTNLKSIVRSTCVLRRSKPLQRASPTWHYTKEYPTNELTQKEDIWEIEDHIMNHPEKRILLVHLLGNVAGLGEAGEIVQIHSQRFWRFLHPLQLARLTTHEEDAKLQSGEIAASLSNDSSKKRKILTGDAYFTGKQILRTNLFIPMNFTDNSISWTLSASHVKIALRRVGVFVTSESCITLPDQPITQQWPLDKQFIVLITINGVEKCPLKCSLFAYQRIDSKSVTQAPTNVFLPVRVENWLEDFDYQQKWII